MKTKAKGSYGKVSIRRIGGKNFAIKQLHLNIPNLPLAKKRLKQEFSILKEIYYENPNIVPKPISFNEEFNEYCMDFFPKTLESHMRDLTSRGITSKKDELIAAVINIFSEIEKLNSLSELLHCDIKPNNFLVKDELDSGYFVQVTLSDFGCSTYKDMPSELSFSYKGLGNPDYIHQDVYSGKEKPNKKYEIYSVLRIINYIQSLGNPNIEFHSEIWNMYKNGEINSFSDLYEIIKSDFISFEDDGKAIKQNDNDFVAGLSSIENIREIYIQIYNNIDSKKRIHSIISENENDLGLRILEDALIRGDEYKEIFHYQHYDLITVFLLDVIKSTRYSEEFKKKAYTILIYIAYEKNSWYTQNRIKDFELNDNIRGNLSDDLVGFIDEKKINRNMEKLKEEIQKHFPQS